MNDRKLLRVLLPLIAVLAVGVTWFTIEKPRLDDGGEVRIDGLVIVGDTP